MARTLTDGQRKALKNVVAAKLRLWDLSTAAEEDLECDIDTDGNALSSLCAGLDSEADIEDVTDAELLTAFGLEDD